MSSIYDSIEFTLYKACKDVFLHDYIGDIMADAKFTFVETEDGNVALKCELPDGYATCYESNNRGINDDIARAISMLRTAIDMYEHNQNVMYDEQNDYDDDDIDYDEQEDYYNEPAYFYEEEPDCEHCEYFHECCGDMDVVDIDFYGFN